MSSSARVNFLKLVANVIGLPPKHTAEQMTEPAAILLKRTGITDYRPTNEVQVHNDTSRRGAS